MMSGVSDGAIFVLLAELGLPKPPSGCISRDIQGGSYSDYYIITVLQTIPFLVFLLVSMEHQQKPVLTNARIMSRITGQLIGDAPSLEREKTVLSRAQHDFRLDTGFGGSFVPIMLVFG